jgi:hypothetical protein
MHRMCCIRPTMCAALARYYLTQLLNNFRYTEYLRLNCEQPWKHNDARLRPSPHRMATCHLTPHHTSRHRLVAPRRSGSHAVPTGTGTVETRVRLSSADKAS